MNSDGIRPATEKLAILILMQQQPDRPWTATDLSDRSHYNPRRVQQILDALIEAGLVAQTRIVSGGEMGYITQTTTLQEGA